MILTSLRLMNSYNKELPEKLICNEEDFSSALLLAENLMAHSSLVYDILPKKNEIYKGYSDKKRNYFEALPLEFARKDADELALKMNLNLKTAEKYLLDYKKEGLILKPEHNKYKKASIDRSK